MDVVPAPVSTPKRPTADLTALASQLRLAVARTARTLRREAGEGVTPTLMCALTTLEHHGPMTVGALAEHERVTKPTVTRTVHALVDQGLVVRTGDVEDGRVVWLTLSGEGRRLVQRVRRKKDEYLSRKLGRLQPDEIEALQRAADLLTRIEDEA
jgi:DNA-binding MarR family transcriptional regulator